MTWNTLIEPVSNADLPPLDDLTEDLLLLESRARGILIDVGWLPQSKPDGRYVLRCCRLGTTEEEAVSAWEDPIRHFECRSFRELRDQLEAWLNDATLVVTKPWER